MQSATQASSSSRSNAAIVTTVDVRPTPQMPLAGSSHGPIVRKQTSKNSTESGSSKEALSDVDTNIPRSQTQEPTARDISTSYASRSPVTSSQPNGQHASPSTCLALAQTIGEIQELYELEGKQGEEIKDLSEQLFAAAWQASMSTPQEIQYRCLERITDLLGEGVERLASLDGKHLRREGKLPERAPSWDFGDLVSGPVLPGGTEKRRLEEAREEVVQAESLPSGSSMAASEIPSDACSPSKRRRLETERLFNSQEVSWAAQVFEEEDSELQGDGGDDTDPDSDGTEPDSDGTEPDDNAEESTAPQASTSSVSSSSANVAHPLATTPPQRPRPLQRTSTSYDLSFNGSLSAPPNPPTPTPTTPRPKSQKKVRPQNIPAPYSQAAGTWQEKGVLERCWDGWGYIDGQLYLDTRNEVSRDKMATEWIDRMI